MLSKTFSAVTLNMQMALYKGSMMVTVETEAYNLVGLSR